MANTASVAPMGIRLTWLDGMKGIAILWIVFFHFFERYAKNRYPWPLDSGYFSAFFSQCAPTSLIDTVSCAVESCFAAVALVGFHAVAVFLVLSGVGLTYSLAKTGNPEDGWAGWYRGRLLRLFPMYWLAHLLYLISPFIARYEPIDYRFILSFLGDRVYPVETIFYYLNPAWWYFGLLLELYLVFPLLFRLLQRLGPTWFFILCGFITLMSRYLLLVVIPVSGYYVQGAFFGARLWEFALGMVIGLLYRRHPAMVEQQLFSGSTLLAGAVLYTIGLYSYETLLFYTMTDALIGTGLFVILAHLAKWSDRLPRVETVVAYVGAYSYGLYLLHQPYVIYFGDRMRGLSLPVFVVLACGIITVITLCTIPLERYVNQLTNHYQTGKKKAQLAVAGYQPQPEKMQSKV